MQTRLALFNADGVEVLPDEKIRNMFGRKVRLVTIINHDTISVSNGHRMYETVVSDYYPNYHIRDVPQYAGRTERPVPPNEVTASWILPENTGQPFAMEKGVISVNSDVYTPLSTALLLFFDAGYTAHRVFDHDRSTVRSVKFKQRDKTPVIAHVEVIDGERYVRNSVLP